MHFYWKNITMAHWIRLSLLCRCKWTRKSDLWGTNVSEQHLLLCKHKRCIMHKWKRRTKTYQEKLEILSNKSRFLCMHKILVHAQHSCACTTLLCMHWRGQGPRPGPKKSAGGPAWAHAQGVLCMHKKLVHAQESWQTNPCASPVGRTSGGFFLLEKRRLTN